MQVYTCSWKGKLRGESFVKQIPIAIKKYGSREGVPGVWPLQCLDTVLRKLFAVRSVHEKISIIIILKDKLNILKIASKHLQKRKIIITVYILGKKLYNHLQSRS